MISYRECSHSTISRGSKENIYH